MPFGLTSSFSSSPRACMHPGKWVKKALLKFYLIHARLAGGYFMAEICIIACFVLQIGRVVVFTWETEHNKMWPAWSEGETRQHAILPFLFSS